MHCLVAGRVGDFLFFFLLLLFFLHKRNLLQVSKFILSSWFLWYGKQFGQALRGWSLWSSFKAAGSVLVCVLRFVPTPSTST
jgi:hypothetical protein